MRTSPAPRLADRFNAEDWRLLTRLPAEVMIVAITAHGATGRRTVAEGLAGLDAIAAGRGSDSKLVRAVVAAIYTEQDDWSGDEPVAEPADQVARVMQRCRRAAEVLRSGADATDATAYLQWVQQVALGVSSASRTGGVLGLGTEQIAAPQRELLDDLAAALS